jgi:hypothetical protein
VKGFQKLQSWETSISGKRPPTISEHYIEIEKKKMKTGKRGKARKKG